MQGSFNEAGGLLFFQMLPGRFERWAHRAIVGLPGQGKFDWRMQTRQRPPHSCGNRDSELEDSDQRIAGPLRSSRTGAHGRKPGLHVLKGSFMVCLSRKGKGVPTQGACHVIARRSCSPLLGGCGLTKMVRTEWCEPNKSHSVLDGEES